MPIHAVGEQDGLLYLVMRLVAGVDLEALLKREGPLAPMAAVSIIEQVASALDAIHGAGLVHRDVKAANVLIERTGGRERAYLSDFGLMRAGPAECDHAHGGAGRDDQPRCAGTVAWRARRTGLRRVRARRSAVHHAGRGAAVPA